MFNILHLHNNILFIIYCMFSFLQQIEVLNDYNTSNLKMWLKIQMYQSILKTTQLFCYLFCNLIFELEFLWLLFFFFSINEFTLFDIQLHYVEDDSTHGSTSSHQSHVTWWQGGGSGCTCFWGFNRFTRSGGQGSNGGRGAVFLEPWTINRNWLKNSSSSMREGMGC